jgi:tetratricopeptide (TPR) repeat protein
LSNEVNRDLKEFQPRVSDLTVSVAGNDLPARSHRARTSTKSILRIVGREKRHRSVPDGTAFPKAIWAALERPQFYGKTEHGTNVSIRIGANRSAGISVSCSQTSQQYVAKGNASYEAGKYDEAIINYKKAIQRDAKFGEGYYRLGLAELKTGHSREAYGALNTALNAVAGPQRR